MPDSDEKRSEVINKIKKMLAMTEQRGATQAEAIQFALKAQQLIAEYDVQEYELYDELHSDKEKIESIYSQVKTPKRWRGWLATVIADNFRCHVYERHCVVSNKKRRESNVVFFGYKHDALAAQIVFDKLYQTGDFLARNATKTFPGHSKQGVYDSFVAGYVEGIRVELEKQSQALMLIRPSEVDTAYNNMHMRKGQRKQWHRVEEAQKVGYQVGREAVRAGRIGSGQQHILTQTT